jgi:hypothetical protein
VSDAETLARVMEEEDLVRAGPDLGLARWGLDALETFLDRLFGDVGGDLPGGERVLWVAVALLSALLVVTLGLFGRQLWHARRAAAAQAVALAPPEPASPEDRRRRLDALLDAGRAREALAELWPWVATRLTARGLGEWEPDRTPREFVATVPAAWPGGRALRSLGRDVERLAWAGDTPSVDEVRGLVVAAEAL